RDVHADGGVLRGVSSGSSGRSVDAASIHSMMLHHAGDGEAPAVRPVRNRIAARAYRSRRLRGGPRRVVLANSSGFTAACDLRDGAHTKAAAAWRQIANAYERLVTTQLLLAHRSRIFATAAAGKARGGLASSATPTRSSPSPTPRPSSS